MTAAEAAVEGTRILARAGIESARLDSELLVCCILGWDRAKLYAEPERPLDAGEARAWRDLLQRRSRREPLPYLLGAWEFFGRAFLVTPAVLIPRPETELLVEALLARRPWRAGPAGARPLIADVGAGSGCIGLTLAAEVPEAILIMTDSSAAALEVARANAARLGLEGRVEARHAAFPLGLDDRRGALDLLASNPPYVAASERAILPPEVRDYEPAEALYAGEDGLRLLRQLIDKGYELLQPGGWIALEFGIDHADPLRAMAASRGFGDITVERDLAGLPRVIIARRPR